MAFGSVDRRKNRNNPAAFQRAIKEEKMRETYTGGNGKNTNIDPNTFRDSPFGGDTPANEVNEDGAPIPEDEQNQINKEDQQKRNETKPIKQRAVGTRVVNRLTERRKINKLKKENKQLKKRIAAIEKQIQAIEKKIAPLERKLKMVKTQIAVLTIIAVVALIIGLVFIITILGAPIGLAIWSFAAGVMVQGVGPRILRAKQLQLEIEEIKLSSNYKELKEQKEKAETDLTKNIREIQMLLNRSLLQSRKRTTPEKQKEGQPNA